MSYASRSSTDFDALTVSRPAGAPLGSMAVSEAAAHSTSAPGNQLPDTVTLVDPDSSTARKGVPPSTWANGWELFSTTTVSAWVKVSSPRTVMSAGLSPTLPTIV